MRTDEIASGLAGVEKRIGEACLAAGRDRGEVTLIAVTKTYPASDVRLLAGLGVRDVGENRDQEAAPKAAACADLPLTWHFVGQLQTNKVRSRGRLRRSWSTPSTGSGWWRRSAGRPSGRAGRSGAWSRWRWTTTRAGAACRPADVPALAEAIAAAPGLWLGGVMAVAPLGEDPAKAFARLREVALGVQEGHPRATMISAGMSGDLAEAVAHGATHVRVGTALLGRRKPFVR